MLFKFIMCLFVLFSMTGASAFLSTIFTNTKCKIPLFRSTLDDDEILKMTKKGIIFYFKSQIQLYQQLLESKDFSSERLSESKASDAELNHLKLKNANAKYLKLKGNLNVRGLIEEYEQSELFKECRKRLTFKVTVIDEVTKRTFVEYRAPSRKMLWDEALTDRELSKLLACIEKSNPERRDTVGERIRDLYSSVSKEVHKSGNNDAISILSDRLYDHEVKLAVCLCEHYNAPYQVEKEGAFQDPDKLQEIDKEEQSTSKEL